MALKKESVADKSRKGVEILSDIDSRLLRTTREFLREHGITPRRRLSQSFVVSEPLIQTMLSAAQLSAASSVLEIGGGLGTLTERLAGCAKRVVVIEIDPDLVAVLERLSRRLHNVEVVAGNVLELEFPQVDTVVSNIPYHLSSRIIQKVFEELSRARAILTLQKEFAERLVGSPGSKDYGRLTLMAYFFAQVRLLDTFPPSAFYPSPEVESTVVSLTPRSSPPFKLNDVGVYFTLCRHLFSQRNRKLGKVIRSMSRSGAYLEQRSANKLLRGASSLIDKRVRELTPEEFALLANMIP